MAPCLFLCPFWREFEALNTGERRPAMKAEFTEGEYSYLSRTLQKLHETDTVEEADMYKTMIIGALEMILDRKLLDC